MIKEKHRGVFIIFLLVPCLNEKKKGKKFTSRHDESAEGNIYLMFLLVAIMKLLLANLF